MRQRGVKGLFPFPSRFAFKSVFNAYISNIIANAEYEGYTDFMSAVDGPDFSPESKTSQIEGISYNKENSIWSNEYDELTTITLSNGKRINAVMRYLHSKYSEYNKIMRIKS